jgi:hypothetical protein
MALSFNYLIPVDMTTLLNTVSKALGFVKRSFKIVIMIVSTIDASYSFCG